MSKIVLRDGEKLKHTHTGFPPIGTAFRGNINGYGMGTYIVTFQGIVRLDPRAPAIDPGSLPRNFQATWDRHQNINIENYKEVDLEIIVMEKE